MSRNWAITIGNPKKRLLNVSVEFSYPNNNWDEMVDNGVGKN